MTTRQRVSFAAGLFSVLVIGIMVGLAGPSNQDVPTSYSSAYRTLPNDPAKPCVAGGLKLSTAEELAQNLRGGELLMPDHRLANASNIEVAWMCIAESADIRFASGIQMTLTPTEDPDLARDWSERIATDPRHNRPAVIRGRTGKTFEVDGDPLRDEGFASVAWLLEDGRLMVIFSETHPLETLQAVAETVQRYRV